MAFAVTVEVVVDRVNRVGVADLVGVDGVECILRQTFISQFALKYLLCDGLTSLFNNIARNKHGRGSTNLENGCTRNKNTKQ